MATRLELDERFRELTPNVYFQPPENLKLVYPCIVYTADRIDTLYCNNHPYVSFDRFSVTVIDRNPESAITRCIAKFPLCRHEQHYVGDNLHHDIFTIY